MTKVIRTPRVKKPRILVIGGEEARNFGSKELNTLFEFEHVDREKETIPKFSGQHFHAVVVLPWRPKHMPGLARKFAEGRKIPCVIVPSIGQMRHYLAEVSSFFREYLKNCEVVKELEVKEETPVAKNPDPPEQKLWDEDQLWEAYGEGFVNAIKGLDGEVTDRKTFTELLEGESGLKGEPIEVLMAILRRQGIISEHDSGMIAIGHLSPADAEKRRQFIENQQRESQGVDGNGSSEKGGSALDMPDEKMLSFYSKVEPSKIWEGQKDLNQELGRLGMGKNGKAYSYFYMNLFHQRAKKLGVLFEPAGGKHSFRILMPGSPAKIQAKVEEKILPAAKPVVPVKAPEGLTSKPFLSAFPVPEEKQAPLPFPQEPEQKDLSKPGVLYESLKKQFSTRRIPDLGAMLPAIKAFRGIFHESQWDLAACKGIMAKLRMEEKEAEFRMILSRRGDFTDGEWVYFAFDFLRDQTLMSLLPVIDVRSGIHRVCDHCERNFYFKVPSYCYDCKDRAL